MSRNDSSAFSAASALVALESLTNSTRPILADLLHAMREAGEAREPPRDLLDAKPQRARGGEGEGGVLAVMRAAQGGRDARDRSAPPRRPSHKAGGRRRRRRRSPSASPKSPTTVRALSARGDGAAIFVVEPDQRDVGGRDQPLLDRGVILHRAVAVEMVGREVDEQADAGLQRGREVDLERRALHDMHAARRGRRQVEHRHADIAAERDVAARPRAGCGRSAPSSSTCRWCR